MANPGSVVKVLTPDGTKRFPPAVLKASEILEALLGSQRGLLESTGPDGISYTGSVKVPQGEYNLVPAASAAGGGTMDQDQLKHVVLEAVEDVAKSMILTKLHAVQEAVAAVQEAVDENRDATEALGAQLGVLSCLELEDFRSDDTPTVLRKEFKPQLQAHYNLEGDQVKCMATGVSVNRGDIQAGHILGVKHKKYAGLMGFDVMSARNGILWLSVLEDAWSKRQFCFTRPLGGQGVVFTLLDTTLEGMRLVDHPGAAQLKRDTKTALGDLTFGGLNGRELCEPAVADQRPYRRALCFMANVHKRLAEKADWPVPDEALHDEIYDFWSEFDSRAKVQQWLATASLPAGNG